MTEESLRKILIEVLDDRSKMDPIEHYDHHLFIKELIEERKMKVRREYSIKEHVIGWSIITVIGGIGAMIARKIGLL